MKRNSGLLGTNRVPAIVSAALLAIAVALAPLPSFAADDGASSSEALPGPAAADAQTIRVYVDTFGDAPDAPGSGAVFTPAFVAALQSVSSKANRRYVRSTRRERADAVVTGQLTIWKDGGWSKMPTVGFNAECVDVATGDVLWSIADVARPWASSREKRTAAYVAGLAATHCLKKIKDQL